MPLNVCQCLDCGAVFDGNQYKVCPCCNSVEYSDHLDIATVYYGDNYQTDSETQAVQIRYYKESMAAGVVFEVNQ
jgi:hypothetical protein